ncbi:hypothetical protein [Sulfurimonas sp.]
MKKIMMSAVALTAIIGSASSVSASDITILSDVKVKGEVRTRYEYADVKSNGVDAANAVTARTELAVTGGLLGVDNLTATLGISTVNNFGYTNYNPADPTYDTIVDPQQAMLSQASVDYKMGKTALHAGRSHINLDDQRFIGTVGWRQMERSYDTLLVANSDVKNLTLIGAYVYGYAGVGSVTTAETGTVLLHANYKVMDALNVTAFGYLLANIHDTYGIRLTGKLPAGPAKLSYAASYAMQTDNSLEYGSAGVTNTVDAQYYDIALNANISGILVGAEYEVLGQNDSNSIAATNGFTTPLATLHKFQGWADVFLGDNNANGLIDMSGRIGYTAKGMGKALVIYHKFDAETGAATDLGSEVDAVYTNKIPGVNGLKGLLKAAFYSGGETGSLHTLDVTKYWVQLDYKF